MRPPPCRAPWHHPATWPQGKPISGAPGVIRRASRNGVHSEGESPAVRLAVLEQSRWPLPGRTARQLRAMRDDQRPARPRFSPHSRFRQARGEGPPVVEQPVRANHSAPAPQVPRYGPAPAPLRSSTRRTHSPRPPAPRARPMKRRICETGRRDRFPERVWAANLPDAAPGDETHRRHIVRRVQSGLGCRRAGSAAGGRFGDRRDSRAHEVDLKEESLRPMACARVAHESGRGFEPVSPGRLRVQTRIAGGDQRPSQPDRDRGEGITGE